MDSKAQVMCKHVYENMRTAICPLCGNPTHETDWEAVHKEHKEWIASGKVTTQGWWSI